MELTGATLLVTLAVMTVLSPGVAMWGWSRARGGRWLVATQRVTMIALSQACALMLAAVALNDYGDFFSSWSQAASALFGSAPASTLGNQGLGDLNSYGAAAPLTPRSTTVVRVRGVDRLPSQFALSDWSSPSQFASRGAIATTELYGPESQLSNNVAVYLPPAYFAGVRSLPLVEAISGYPSTAGALTNKLSMPERLLTGIQRGSMGQFVLVMAPSGLPYPLDSECTDAPGGPFAFTYFDRDIPQQLSRLLGLKPPELAALGYSTGGYCAVKLAMVDPERFVAAVSMSGYFYAQPGRYSPDMFAGSSSARHLNDLRWRLQHLPPPRTSVLVMTGTDEQGADGWINNNAFLRSVRAPMHAERFIVPVDYGHTYRTWTQEVSPALVWISRSIGVVKGGGGIGSALFSRPGRHAPRHHRRATPAAAA